MTEFLSSELLERLRRARRVAVLTGTGVASESGVPSPRETMTGKWASYELVDLATQQGFLRNPRLVWQWYAARREQIEALQPGVSHYALVDLEQYFDTFTLITQAIDGLHWRAGSRDLLELHGNLMRTRCFECGTSFTAWDDEIQQPPLCPYDGGYLRPDVVWLGEGLPANLLSRAYRATEGAEVFLSVGATARVAPADALPLIAKRAGAFVIEINPEETALAVIADLWIPATASAVLSSLVEYLLGDNRSDNGGGLTLL